MPNYNPYNRRRMSLNTVGFQPTVFTPIEFRPVEQDYSILERSLARQEARQREAAEKESAIDVALGKIETELHNDPETQQWFSNYKNSIKKDINDAAQVRDYASAINLATKLAGTISSDSALLGRVKANQEYQAKVDETHKRVLAGQISQDTERWWLANNQFKYEDVVDNNGQVIGGTSYSTLDVPVADINISELTQNAFKLISPKMTDNQLAKEDGTGSHYRRQWVTRKQIVDNLNEILDDTPGARAAMYQRYQVEMHNYRELLNNDTADSGRIIQQRNRMEKNGSPVSFEDFCVREIEQSAISQNLAYDYKTSVVDKQPTSKGGSGSGVSNTNTETNDTLETSVTGNKTTQEDKTVNARSDADNSGETAGDMHRG